MGMICSSTIRVAALNTHFLVLSVSHSFSFLQINARRTSFLVGSLFLLILISSSDGTVLKIKYLGSLKRDMRSVTSTTLTNDNCYSTVSLLETNMAVED